MSASFPSESSHSILFLLKKVNSKFIFEKQRKKGEKKKERKGEWGGMGRNGGMGEKEMGDV